MKVQDRRKFLLVLWEIKEKSRHTTIHGPLKICQLVEFFFPKSDPLLAKTMIKTPETHSKNFLSRRKAEHLLSEGAHPEKEKAKKTDFFSGEHPKFLDILTVQGLFSEWFEKNY